MIHFCSKRLLMVWNLRFGGQKCGAFSRVVILVPIWKHVSPIRISSPLQPKCVSEFRSYNEEWLCCALESVLYLHLVLSPGFDHTMVYGLLMRQNFLAANSVLVVISYSTSQETSSAWRNYFWLKDLEWNWMNSRCRRQSRNWLVCHRILRKMHLKSRIAGILWKSQKKAMPTCSRYDEQGGGE